MLIYLFAYEREMIKFVNHARKILNLEQDVDAWFQDVLRYSRIASLCATGYKTINHGMFAAFVERWNNGTLYFHIPHGEMSITLDDVLFLLHLSIRGRLLNHFRIIKFETLELMVNYLETDSGEV